MAVGKFSFYRSFDEAARDLPDADRLRLYDAMSDYVFRGIVPDFDGVLGIVWKLVRPNLDSSVRGQETGGRRKPKAASDDLAEGASQGPVGEGVPEPSEGPVRNAVDEPSEGPLRREMIRKRRGKEEEKRGSARDGGAAGAKAPPPSALCPMCEAPMRRNTNTGRFECPSCHDTWSKDEAVWR